MPGRLCLLAAPAAPQPWPMVKRDITQKIIETPCDCTYWDNVPIRLFILPTIKSTKSPDIFIKYPQNKVCQHFGGICLCAFCTLIFSPLIFLSLALKRTSSEVAFVISICFKNVAQRTHKGGSLETNRNHYKQHWLTTQIKNLWGTFVKHLTEPIVPNGWPIHSDSCVCNLNSKKISRSWSFVL